MAHPSSTRAGPAAPRRGMSDLAIRLDEKSLEDVGEDLRTFVREKPALAVGIAAGVGYMLARLLRR